jgi:phage terminase large subunit
MPFHNREQRWALIVAHRRAGKTVACINDVIKRAIVESKKNGRYAYIAPFMAQAKAVAWTYLLEYTAPIAKHANASELWVELINGSRIRLYGADNAEALRGQYFDGVIADEFGDWKPGIWGAIIRPALSDRRGWAVFIGTPKGHNEFYEQREIARNSEDWFYAELKASETGIIDAEELEDARRLSTEDQFAQEFECSFDAAIQGAIYAKYINDSQVTRVQYDPRIPVHTSWDLGMGDATAIWFWQVVNTEYRVIDYYEASGEGLSHYVQVLQGKGYTYGKHFAPHDIEVRELGTGTSRYEIGRQLGIVFEVVKQHRLEDGINALRMILPMCWFDAEKAKQGLESLRYYRWRANERLGGFTNTPEHDWSSHAADAARYFAMGFKQAPKQEPINYPSLGVV